MSGGGLDLVPGQIMMHYRGTVVGVVGPRGERLHTYNMSLLPREATAFEPCDERDVPAKLSRHLASAKKRAARRYSTRGIPSSWSFRKGGGS